MTTADERLREMGYMVTMIQSLLLELTQEMDAMRESMLQDDDDPMDGEERRERHLELQNERFVALAAYNTAEGLRNDEFPEPDTEDHPEPVPDQRPSDPNPPEPRLVCRPHEPMGLATAASAHRPTAADSSPPLATETEHTTSPRAARNNTRARNSKHREARIQAQAWFTKRSSKS